MDDVDGLDGFDDQVAALERSLGGAQAVAAAFDSELIRMSSTIADTGRDVGLLSSGFSRGLRRSIDSLIFDGEKLSNTFRGLAQSMLNTAYSTAMRPVTNHIGGLMATGVERMISGVLPFEKGGAFTQGRVMPFARGGIVSSPVSFPMRGGVGLMGEAGPEAIMPLSRGPDGRLGVRTEGGGRPVSVVINVSTPDAQSFQRSQSQIAAQMSRALGRGQRNR